MKYSVIIPVYNRPREIDELLSSLAAMDYADFEVIVVEDGSEQDAEDICLRYQNRLSLRYFKKENTGQGFSRNWAAEKATGKYLVFFDSDCLVPPTYFKEVDQFYESETPDAWGGPDKAHPDFTPLQRAIGFTMSAGITTGGIRGKKSSIGRFQPRTFNMGIDKNVFMKLGGFAQTNLGEDIELSTRLIRQGYQTALIEAAFVYHKRRETIQKFIMQMYNFGKGRVVNSRKNRGSLKVVHLLPLFFLLGLLSVPLLWAVDSRVFWAGYSVYGLYLILVGMISAIQSKNLWVGLLSIPVAFFQLTGYGVGMGIHLLKK